MIRTHRRGFTIAELLTVLVILGLIALVAVPTYQRVIGRASLEAADRSFEATVRLIETHRALEGTAWLEQPVEDLAAELSALTGDTWTTGQPIQLGQWSVSRRPIGLDGGGEVTGYRAVAICYHHDAHYLVGAMPWAAEGVTGILNFEQVQHWTGATIEDTWFAASACVTGDGTEPLFLDGWRARVGIEGAPHTPQGAVPFSLNRDRLWDWQ